MMTFAEYITQNRGKPFKWGTHDCCLFVADWLLAKESDFGDIAAEFRGNYDSQLTAFKRLREQGFNDLQSVFNAKLGNSVPALQLRRGDVVLLATPAGDVMGLFGGNQCFALAESGVDAYSRAAIKMGWHV
ncbi:hypothetical protein KDN34_02880 [Shewanella yunxiaonensis]|uniref:DUF6950 domain-containing protein n=1 Tax=Shewanella yunxiaonensis TaxID=2829809 RepID=A0ABX7YVQ9_9GAMM|nr:hypothetical protein [Shewanella yunxiaonensis]QUN06425.1 hypothetical protein KDN34_02880 [Shewanella yunxiaonensis]